MTGRSKGWVVVVFENEHGNPDEVAYIKGPWQQFEDADEFRQTHKDCADGRCQITFIEAADES